MERTGCFENLKVIPSVLGLWTLPRTPNTGSPLRKAWSQSSLSPRAPTHTRGRAPWPSAALSQEHLAFGKAPHREER